MTYESNKMGSWSDFFRSATTTLRDATNSMMSSLSDWKMPRIGLMADGFKIGGFPLYLSETFKYPLTWAISFYQIALAQAQEGIYKNNTFTDPTGKTQYEMNVVIGSDADALGTVTKAIKDCFAIINQPNSNVTYELIRVVQETVGNGLGSHPVDAVKFWRASNESEQASFEKCCLNIIDPSSGTAAIVGSIIIFCLILGCCFCIYKSTNLCETKNSDENRFLLNGDTKKRTCCNA